MKARAAALILLLVAMAAARACAEPHRLVVVATIPPLAAIAKEVGGDRVEVHYLVPPTSDPHQFALRASDLRLLERCDLLIAIGKEPFLGAIPPTAGRARLGWSDWSRAGVYFGPGNPHYLWLYPPNAVKVARVIAEALSRLDPEGAQYYRARLKAFEARVGELEEWCRNYVRVSGVYGAPIVLAADHFEPLAEYMGLRVVAIASVGGATPSPEDLARVEAAVRESGALAVIALATERGGDEGRVARAISEDTGIPVVYLYGVMFGGNDTYAEFIKYTVSALVAGLQAAAERGKAAEEQVSPIVAVAAGVAAALAVEAIRYVVRWGK